MRWRLTSSEFQHSTKTERVAELERLVRDGTPVGMLAYLNGEPKGWCSIAPRETYSAIARSRSIPRVDEVPVWSVVCFFLDRTVRGLGLRVKLLEAAVAYARDEGAAVVEGYPVEPGGASYGYMGPPSMYEAVGFREVARTTGRGAVPRRIVRRSTDG
jgi:GNAT superfamily N-acetyltransferase